MFSAQFLFLSAHGNQYRSHIFAIHFLDIIAGCRIGARFVKPNHIGRPLCIADPCKKRRVRSQNHHIRIFFDARQKSGFRERTLQGICFRTVHAADGMGRVFSGKNFDVPRILVIKIHMLIKPFWLHIIMFIHRIAEIRFSFRRFTIKFPGLPVTIRCDIRPRGTNQPDFRVFFMYCLLKKTVTRKKINPFRFPLFVSDAGHFQAKRLRVAHPRTQPAPFRLRRAVGELD